MFYLHDPLEAAANVLVPSTVATEGIQVDPGDPIADKRNAFFSLVFRPVPPPILATPAPRRARAPKEVAITPRRSGRIEKRKQKRKDAVNAYKTSTTQELFGPPGREQTSMTSPLPPSLTSLRPLCRLLPSRCLAVL